MVDASDSPVTSLPSIATAIDPGTTWSIEKRAAATSWSAENPNVACGGQAKLSNSAFNTGKNNATPDGIVQLRNTVDDEVGTPGSVGRKVPPRNHTGPRWPARQSTGRGSAGVPFSSSNTGLSSRSVPYSHCHHRAFHSA